MQGLPAVGSLRTEVPLVHECVLVGGRAGKLVGESVLVGDFWIYDVSRVLYPWLALLGDRHHLARRQTLAQYRLSRSCPGFDLRPRSGPFVPDRCALNCCLDCPGGSLPVRGRRPCQNHLSLCPACQDLPVHLGHFVGVPLLWVGPPPPCPIHRRG